MSVVMIQQYCRFRATLRRGPLDVPLYSSFRNSSRASDKMLTTERTETTEKGTSAGAARDYHYLSLLAHRFFLRLFSVTSVASVVKSFLGCGQRSRYVGQPALDLGRTQG
jgi:hypothetical protein